MRLETTSGDVQLVTKRSELWEGAGLIPLLVVPFLLASSWIGVVLAVAVIFSAAVIHSAIRNV
jgi:hypothetical protein